MTAVVTRDGADALKVFAHGNLAQVEQLVHLTGQLQAAGVPVPSSNIVLRRPAIRLPWIHGQTMRELISRTGPNKDCIEAAMQLLLSLHKSGVRSAGLDAFNPFRQTDRRLGEPWFAVLPERLRTEALALRAALARTTPDQSGWCIIHGDFHAGQLMHETNSRKWWMIDLDDTAYGHKEADIANFCVNLATRHQASTPAIKAELEQLQDACSLAYRGGVDARLFDYYAACALLRRALKFASKPNGAARAAAAVLAGRARS